MTRAGMLSRAGAAAARGVTRRAVALPWFQERLWELMTARRLFAADEADPRLAFLRHVAARGAESRAQLFQDLWVLWARGDASPGFFVEFGATDGVDLSNTMLLERGHGWRGILAEPNPHWHAALRRNRVARIDARCVWHTGGQRLEFTAPAGMPEYAGLSSRAFDDPLGARRRAAAATLRVPTITLLELLEAHAAPPRIDYLSIDTEGSELDILQAFDFGRYQVDRITVEHNYDPVRREGLRALLERNGYERRFPELSRWDDWYEHREALRGRRWT